MKTCKKCKFYIAEDIFEIKGECYRNPPTVILDEQYDSFHTVRPDVSEKSIACGEFRRRWFK